MANPLDDLAPPSPLDDLPPPDKYDRVAQVALAKPKIGDSVANFLEEAGSNMYHGAVGGYRGVGKLITGQGLNAAVDAIDDETSKAYQAPDSALKSAMTSKYNPLNYAQEGADYLADKSADWGASPGVSTAIKSAPTAIAALTGTAGLLKGPARSLVNQFKPPVPAKTYTAEEALANSTAPQSMGAASTPRDLSVADPGLRSAIERHAASNDGKIEDLDALDRHLDTAQLPLPDDGKGPLRLRRGQATQDAQQISDEKNLRADPDTQGVLTASIEDQDKKLTSSIGEIQRRANPDIVQRNNVDHGQAAVNAIKQRDNEALTDIRAKYKALTDANGGSVPIDTGTAIDTIKSQLGKRLLSKAAAADPTISEIMDTLNSGKPIDFETFEDMRSNLAEVMRGKGPTKKAAGIIRDTLENMPLTEDAMHLKGLANDARAAAKARFDTIEANPAYKAAIEDNVEKTKDGLHDLTQESPLAANFMNRYVLGDGVSAAPAFIKRLKAAVPDQGLSSAMEAATLNHLRDAAGVDALGHAKTGFQYSPFFKAVTQLDSKGKVGSLLNPETIENVQRLKRVAGYVNEEGKATAVNRSNTMLALERHGAVFPKDPQLISHLLDVGADAAAGHFGPVGVLGKKMLDSKLKDSKNAKALQSVRDAKLEFARDAVKPGAGLEGAVNPAQPPIARASGGKVTEDMLVNRLTRRWQAAKRATDETTKPLLNVPDAAITRALDIAQEHL